MLKLGACPTGAGLYPWMRDSRVKVCFGSECAKNGLFGLGSGLNYVFGTLRLALGSGGDWIGGGEAYLSDTALFRDIIRAGWFTSGLG